MNIFYLDHDVVKCAEYHNTKHNVKLILEQVQLLSTAHRVLDGSMYIENNGRKIKRFKISDDRDTTLYKATHINHPSAMWVRESNENYIWLHRMTVALCKEYTHRYGKIHKCESSGILDILNRIPDNIPIGNFTEPTPAMDPECIIPGDSIASYRNYYIKKKQHLANWEGKLNNRKPPEWYQWI